MGACSLTSKDLCRCGQTGRAAKGRSVLSTILAVVGLGAVTPVGWTAAQTCAAVRAALTGFCETGFETEEPLPGPLKGAPAPLAKPAHRSPPFERLALLAARAVGEALDSGSAEPARTALLLAVREPYRADPVLDRQLPQLLA